MTLADTAGVAQASMTALDTNADIFRPRRLSSRPTRVPVSRVSGTTTAAKIRLIRSDSQNSGSARVALKLAPPTHLVGATPVTCGSPYSWKENSAIWMVGQSSSSPIAAADGSSSRYGVR